jgi:hypothetical protein
MRVMNTHPEIKLTFQSSYVSIQISFQKAQKTWIKRSSRVITWLGYKRNVICGAIEIKKPSKEEYSLYQPLKSTTFPTKHYKPLVLHMIHFDLDNLFYFWIFLSFLFFFFFSCTHCFLFFFFLYLQHHVVLIKNKITPLYLTKDLHLPSLPNLNQIIPYLNVPLL